jgi:integrase
MSLEEARRRAEDARGIVRDGRDPVAENRIRKIRNRTVSATTFEGIANELLEGKKKNVSPAYYKKLNGGIKANLFPMLGSLPIQSINAPVLREALRKIEARGALEMLGNVRRWAGEIFDYAKAHGAYEGDNPATALLRNVFKKHKGENMRSLEWSALPGFVKALETMSAEPETICAIRLLILSACRPGEVRGAKWVEIDMLHARWTIAGERMKMKKPHAVPLSKQMIAVLKELQKLSGHSEYLFPSRPGATTKILSDMALLKAVRRAAGCDIHAHGFRSMFSTYVAESLKWPDAVKEAALAHSKQGVEGAYDRATHYAERAKLMQWWADEIDSAVKGADVLQFSSRTAA